MTEDDGGLGVITLTAAMISMVKIAKEILSPTSGENTMVAIPSDMELYVLIAAIAFAVFFGICAFLYRYAEHNAKYDLDRKSNKLFGKSGAKFIGAEGMAIGLTAVLAFYGAAVAPAKLGIIEPALIDYILAAGVIALICGILLTVLFNEGISGLGKFIKQKADETAEAANDLVEAAKKLGLNKKQTKKFIEMKQLEAAMAAAAEEPKAEDAAPAADGDIVVPLEGQR